MTKWGSAKGSMTRFEDGVFSLRIEPAHEHRAILYRWTIEICLYRLHHHFERKEQKQGLPQVFLYNWFICWESKMMRRVKFQW